MLIETIAILNEYFDLTSEVGNRPKAQSSYVLWGSPELDLKSKVFIESYKVSWLDFQLTAQDELNFSDMDILSIKNDKVAQGIFDWYYCHIHDNSNIISDISEYFKKKIDNLNKYGK